MGIKDLLKFVKDKHPGVISPLRLSDLPSKNIFYDTSIIIYKALSAMNFKHNKSVYTPRTESGTPYAHILSLLVKAREAKKAGVNPVWVFEGPSSEMKAETITKRIQNSRESRKLAEKNELEGDLDSALKYTKRSVRVSDSERILAQRVMRIIGQQVVESGEESDRVLTYLARENDGVVYTDDSDLLALGVKYLIRKGEKKDTYDLYDGDLLREQMGLDRRGFAAFCVLLGTDYNSNLPRVRKQMIIEDLREGKSIQDILKKYQADEEFSTKARVSFEYFSNEERPIFSFSESIENPRQEAEGFVASLKPSKSKTSIEKSFAEFFKAK